MRLPATFHGSMLLVMGRPTICASKMGTELFKWSKEGNHWPHMLAAFLRLKAAIASCILNQAVKKLVVGIGLTDDAVHRAHPMPQRAFKVFVVCNANVQCNGFVFWESIFG